MVDKKTSMVLFGYTDGSYEYAVGDHAEEVSSYLNAAQSMQYIHGGPYKGERMICVPASGQDDLESIQSIIIKSLAKSVDNG